MAVSKYTTHLFPFLLSMLKYILVEKEQVNAMYLDFKQHYDVQQRDTQIVKKRLAEET
jgi:hypothetical protein